MASFFDHPYYKWNKFCLSYFGTWPEQTLFMRCLLPFVTWAILMTLFTVMVLRLPSSWHDLDHFLDSMSPLLVIIVGYVQLFNGSFNHKKMSMMLGRISLDWKRFGQSPNIEIIQKYAAKGCSITKAYSGWMYFACLIYLMMPVVMPIVIEFVVPLNETRKKIYLYEAEYGVNPDDYYWLILAHGYSTSYLLIIIIISSDVMFFTMVEHACALFEIVGINLEMVRSNKADGGEWIKKNGYKMICHCVNLHREAIIFADLIESSYTACFVGVIGLSLLILSISGVQTLMHLDEPGEALRYGSFSIAQIFHLYFNSVPGQKMMDYSLSVFDCAYAVDWHDLTPKAQKLLIFIMMRSLRPCQITAGKVYILSMESYSSVIQTSMSCFTVLSSML